ncbi:ATP-binding domain-containing protein, partial [Nocardia farcinica]|uniref:ATP-binding domain-containing protein n=1 Tax=Nocardia farcinica TaxID=37329 RepID=UPI0024563D84
RLLEFRKADARDVQIDHVYPLAAAWDLGAAGWSPEQVVGLVEPGLEHRRGRAGVLRRPEHHGPGTTAVIAPHELTDALAEVDGEAVRVLTVSEVKGLEFDTVLLVEPARIVEESPRGLNDLYVALTRATQRLHVLHTAELPEVLGALA